jgi:T6SS immunity protein Tdi1, C-terminal
MRFLAAYELTGREAGPPLTLGSAPMSNGGFVSEYSGATFDLGLYRIHTRQSQEVAHSLVRESFPTFADRLTCFAFDWLGRQFALDSARIERGEPFVAMVEPGTGEVLEIPATMQAFHDVELVDAADAALARSFFTAWAAAHPEGLPLSHRQCVGYQTPLFLGGRDSLGNLEITDLAVYWSLAGQLMQAAHPLSPGTHIDGVDIS